MGKPTDFDFDFESAPSTGSGKKGGNPPSAAGAFGAPRTSGAFEGLDFWTDKPRKAPGSYIHSLNDCQKEAVLATDGPLIVLAGAGSGKTKMLTSRISYLIEAQGVAPHRILAVTFTNKAAAEMRERVEKTLASCECGALGTPEIGTFHSVCVRLLRREMDRTPFTKPFVIYDDSDQLSLIKTVMGKLQIDDKTINPKAVQGSINRAKCDALDPEHITPSPHNFFEKQFKKVYEQYQKDLFANNALDFGEIICMVYRILRDHEDVRAKYQKRFRFVHVDEYQDTNRAQYLMLSMLTKGEFGGHGNICVVGDEDQSIYKWRGADIRNILDFEADYPGARVVKLEQNYRSTKTIIKAAGHVIRNNASRKDKTLWTDNEEGTKIVHARVPDERMEAELTVSEIKRLAQADGRNFTDFAVFYRTNAQSRQFEDVLRREKIPYQIVGGLRFYDRKEIKDVLSYFKVILNPADSVSLKRIINVPGRGIGKTTIEKLEEFHASVAGREFTFWQVLERAAKDPSMTSSGTAKKLASFVELVSRFIEAQPRLLMAELYHLVLDETGYVRDLRKEGTEEATARIENLEEFDTLLQEFDEDNFLAVPEESRQYEKSQLLPLFIEQSTLASEVDQQDGAASTIKLMTLHSSKGLEFPVVFMVGMEEGLFPSLKLWEEIPLEDVEEERRLCYVGMTRARQKLYMINAVMRRLWGNVNYNDPSRFFDEIPHHFLEYHDFASRMGGGVASAAGAGRQSAYGDDESDGDRYRASPTRPVPGAAGLAAGRSSGSSSDEWVGRKLNHTTYGPGTIIAIEGSGAERKVTVEFRGKQQKKFLLRYVEAHVE